MSTLAHIETDFCVFQISGPERPVHGFLGANTMTDGQRLIASSNSEIHKVSSGHLFYEEVDYVITVQSNVRDYALTLDHRDPGIVEAISPIPNVFPQTLTGVVRFRQSVGWTDFHIAAGPSKLSVSFEIFPTKIDYYQDYAEMLRRVRDVDRLLCLRYFADTYQCMSIEPGATSQLDWLSILRSQIVDLKQALHYAALHPLSTIESTVDYARAERIRGSNAVALKAVIRQQGTGRMTNVNGLGDIHSWLPTSSATDSYDCAEHRWIASQLESIRANLRLLVSELRPSKSRQAHPSTMSKSILQQVSEIESFTESITELLRLPILENSLGKTVPPGFSSLRMTGSPGYGAAFSLLLSIHYGLSTSVGSIEISVDKLGTLYEVWCFVEVVSILQKQFGDPSPTSVASLVFDSGFGRRLKDGSPITLDFSFHGDSVVEVSYHGLFRSKSGIQQPDIVLTFRKPGWSEVLVIMDAKYRLNLDGRAREMFGIIPPPQDAINALHRYRDAILITESSHLSESSRKLPQPVRPVSRGVALYPLPMEESSSFMESKLWAAIQEQGIGAIPMLPGNTSHFENWIVDLFELPVETLAVAFPPHGNMDFFREPQLP